MELPPRMPPPPGAFLSQAWPDVSSSEGEEGGGTIQNGQPIKTPEAPKATPPPPQVIDDAPPVPQEGRPPPAHQAQTKAS
ncbi:hypothetical protein CgunFtcFv8_027553 [Champsocephalus gunnari]|uniref:Uncharacterized protein n=1 Tax=Champsocephalus gunnari TaxID=52237 RepID=A0AAN8HXG7_CHAGU|nr:hypothetical protein CgunFtcFv8_027553 [Champsocephalus gunnari]